MTQLVLVPTDLTSTSFDSIRTGTDSTHISKPNRFVLVLSRLILALIWQLLVPTGSIWAGTDATITSTDSKQVLVVTRSNADSYLYWIELYWY